MDEMKEGKLKSGRSGKKVASRKQAIAIGLSEARKEGGKAPKKSSVKNLQRNPPQKRRRRKKQKKLHERSKKPAGLLL